MIDGHAEHQSMIRRVEQARKAIAGFTGGRGRMAGLARALDSVLDEAYERMTMAWSVLYEPHFSAPKHYTYRQQKAAELSLCYTTISNAYDELCLLNIISRDDKTEPTTHDRILAAKEEERATRQRRRAAAAIR